MTRVNWLYRLGLLLVCVAGLCGCQTRSNHPYPRFQDNPPADVVLEFNRWDCIFMIRPRYHEDGFLCALTPKTLGPALDLMQVQRQLAVVTIGWTYDRENLAQLVREWNAILKTNGFARVVCVRAALSKKIDGAIVINDSNWAGDTPK